MSERNESLLLTPGEQLVFHRFGVRLRFFTGLLAGSLVAMLQIFDAYPEFPVAGTLVLTAFVLAYNTLAGFLLRGLAVHHEPARNRLDRLQITITLLDQIALTGALYLMAGLEAFILPVILLATFMVAINSGKRLSYFFYGTELLFVGILFVAQHLGYVGYHSVLPLGWTGVPGYPVNPHTATWAALSATWLVLAGLLFGVIYFSNFVKDKYARVFDEILEGRQEITSLRQLSSDILDIFPYAVITVRADGVIEEANPAASALLGANPSWIGRKANMVEELAAAGLGVYFDRALRGDEVRINEFPLVRSGGKRNAFLSITVLPVRRAGGTLERILFCAEDATDRRKRDQEQREMQQALLQTEKMASLGQMAAGVAHELNNPLTAIDAYAQYLVFRLRNGDTIGKDSLQRVERILENSERIRNLVKNLLSYARPAPETILALNLATLIDEALIFVEHEARRRDVEILRDYAADLPRVTGTKIQLQQMFVNLFTNALQAVEPGKGRIVVATQATPQNVTVSVSDNGKGIERNLLERIFEPFFSTKDAGEGTGLGLSIVSTIVEKHGAAIDVKSEPGSGTTFSVSFPREETQPAAS